MIRKGDLCFDVGANRGQKALIFLSLGARIISVEPQKRMHHILQERFRGNSRITVVNCALGDRPGEAMLTTSSQLPEVASLTSDWATRSRFAGKVKFDGEEKVAVRTLDDLIAEFGLPNFCKIDVEGFEKSVLKGLHHKIPLLSFEFNREFFDEALECIRILEELGAAEFNCAVAEPEQLYLSSWVTGTELFTQLSNHPDPLLWGDIYVRFNGVRL